MDELAWLGVFRANQHLCVLVHRSKGEGQSTGILMRAFLGGLFLEV